MTIKQAINIMTLWKASVEFNGAKGDVVEAMNMAIKALTTEQEQECEKCIFKPFKQFQPDTRLAKIADLVEGTIDHFDLVDAMDLLYQIKEVLK